MATYYVHEFARLAGVTVRTLHYYDQVGLLTPAKRNNVRLYRQQDLLRLQQILTLKSIGFALDEIRALLDSPTYDVLQSLRIQKDAIDRRVKQLQQASRGLELTIAHLENGRTLDWAEVAAIITAVNTTDKRQWYNRYFSDAQLAQIYARRMTPDEVEAGRRAWADLIAAFRSLQHLPPDHPDVQRLVPRLDRMVEQFTRGDAGIYAALQAMYRDIEQIPAEYRRHDAELQRFMNEACRIYAETKRGYETPSRRDETR
ncbi:MAG: MerR family transcriptional regulator [Chloroflexales bacterium]|nr:MerR family transcriptional regulator [Chloroflexales bacterium]